MILSQIFWLKESIDATRGAMRIFVKGGRGATETKDLLHGKAVELGVS